MSETCEMPDMSGGNKVRSLVDKYCTSERHPELTKFIVHGPFALRERWNSNAVNMPGCYVIYGDNGRLRYIGMSQTNVGDRVRSHFSTGTQQSEFWVQGPPATFVDVIEVAKPWEPPSLEQYLIAHTRDIVYTVL